MKTQVFKKPVCCYNYPKAIKAFYMRENDVGPDGRVTVLPTAFIAP